MQIADDNYMQNDNYFTTHIFRNAENLDVMEVCGGDSGGPLVHQDLKSGRWTIVGTVYGGKYDCFDGTGSSGPSVWNKVTAHLDWIKEITDQSKVCTTTNK